jgi:hypothetical protein
MIFFQVSLWGNKCDLSISAGEHNDQKVDPLSQLESLEANILANHLDEVWQILSQGCSAIKTVGMFNELCSLLSL